MIATENGKKRYFDKNGKEITEGCIVRYPNGRKMTIYETENDELGIDATNPKWIECGRAIPCEFGVYPLNVEDTEMVEVVE